MIYHEVLFQILTPCVLIIAGICRILMYRKDTNPQRGTTFATFLVLLVLCNTLYYYTWAEQHHCVQALKDAKAQEEQDIVVARKNWLEWQESNESRDDYTTLFYVDNNRNRKSNFVEN